MPDLFVVDIFSMPGANLRYRYRNRMFEARWVIVVRKAYGIRWGDDIFGDDISDGARRQDQDNDLWIVSARSRSRTFTATNAALALSTRFPDLSVEEGAMAAQVFPAFGIRLWAVRLSVLISLVGCPVFNVKARGDRQVELLGKPGEPIR